MPPSTLCMGYVRRDGWEHCRLAGGGSLRSSRRRTPLRPLALRQRSNRRPTLRSTPCRPPLCAIVRFRIPFVAGANYLRFSTQGVVAMAEHRGSHPSKRGVLVPPSAGWERSDLRAERVFLGSGALRRWVFFKRPWLDSVSVPEWWRLRRNPLASPHPFGVR